MREEQHAVHSSHNRNPWTTYARPRRPVESKSEPSRTGGPRAFRRGRSHVQAELEVAGDRADRGRDRPRRHRSVVVIGVPPSGGPSARQRAATATRPRRARRAAGRAFPRRCAARPGAGTGCHCGSRLRSQPCRRSRGRVLTDCSSRVSLAGTSGPAGFSRAPWGRCPCPSSSGYARSSSFRQLSRRWSETAGPDQCL